MIRHCRYVIAVQDLRRSAEYYRNILGFEVLQITDPGWRVFQRDDCVIMAGECRDALSPATLGDHSYFALGAKARVPYEFGPRPTRPDADRAQRCGAPREEGN